MNPNGSDGPTPRVDGEAVNNGIQLCQQFNLGDAFGTQP
jgi:hypothetical protein